MGMTPDGIVKFNCDMAFINGARDIGGPTKLSAAPDDPKYGTWFMEAFSSKFKERALRTMRGLYGKEVEDVEIERYRMCW